jgi:hypothetical protein
VSVGDEARCEQAVEFLHEAARYFEKRPTGGEDRAHWSNVMNAKNCRDIAELIAGLKASREGRSDETD